MEFHDSSDVLRRVLNPACSQIILWSSQYPAGALPINNLHDKIEAIRLGWVN